MSKKIFKRLSFLFPFFLLFISGCRFSKKTNVKKDPQETVQPVEKKRPTLTVWVHGTRAVSKTVFPRFFRTIPNMHHASAYNSKNNLLQVATTLSTTDPEQFPFENLFIFGWDGRLSPAARMRAAKKLRKAIFELLEKEEKRYGVRPYIRLITHSHGGNVALYLAQLNGEDQTQLEIDELVLLACPVQRRTCDLISDGMFKKIYSLYSTIDMIQVLDPQGIQKLWSRKEKRIPGMPLFSKRTFPAVCNNLRQVKVTLNGKAIRHIDFILEKFLRQLPKMLNDLRA